MRARARGRATRARARARGWRRGRRRGGRGSSCGHRRGSTTVVRQSMSRKNAFLESAKHATVVRVVRHRNDRAGIGAREGDVDRSLRRRGASSRASSLTKTKVRVRRRALAPRRRARAGSARRREPSRSRRKEEQLACRDDAHDGRARRGRRPLRIARRSVRWASTRPFARDGDGRARPHEGAGRSGARRDGPPRPRRRRVR